MWYWFSMGVTGWYLVVLVQYGAVLVDTWWHWVPIGGTAWYFVVLGLLELPIHPSIPMGVNW